MKAIALISLFVVMACAEEPYDAAQDHPSEAAATPGRQYCVVKSKYSTGDYSGSEYVDEYASSVAALRASRSESRQRGKASGGSFVRELSAGCNNYEPAQ